MSSRQIVVFTGSDENPSVIENIEAIAGRFPHWKISVFHQQSPRRWRQYIRSKIRLLRSQPVSCLIETSAAVLTKLWRRVHTRVQHETRSPLRFDQLNNRSITYHRCSSLRDLDVLRAIRSLDPWVGIAIGAPILKPETFTIPEVGTINLHKSLLPMYRGMPPGFWELYDGADVTGASVHWVDEKLDTGDIIAQQTVPIPKYATPVGLAAMLDLCGTRVLLNALEKIDQDQANATSQQSVGNKPNRAPPLLLAQRVQERARKKRLPPKSLRRCFWNTAKRGVVGFFVYVWVPVRNRVRSLLGRSHVTVMLYHRVDDSLHDTVTVGVEQFSRQLSVIAKHYDVLDMKTFLMGRGQPRKRPAVVITFDDGYACNYLAAVLLRRAGFPCTFFLSSGMIGTERPFRHDIKRLGWRVPSLTWKQVKRMAEWGFDFGPHTVGHVRLADLPQDKALQEIEASKECLERQLGVQEPIEWFAYPYGKKDDIRSETKESLRSIGIEYCFSAYGGTNGPDWEPLNILRTGVDASFSSLAFRAVIEGW